ncbi:MAG: MoxR family ATPase [Thermoguttaceae bacterium]|nr:MoxR family ATPase [Thermoguttaceae bacterium]
MTQDASQPIPPKIDRAAAAPPQIPRAAVGDSSRRGTGGGERVGSLADANSALNDVPRAAVGDSSRRGTGGGERVGSPADANSVLNDVPRAAAANAPSGDLLAEFRRACGEIEAELQKVVVGQKSVIRLLLASVFTRGHSLLEGVPGLAKTLLVSTLARVLDIGFKRIQFTPDLMPSDITGTNLLDVDEEGKRHFRFVKGPIWTNILLADEINRTPPKTQAALLQAMQEREVTVGKATLPLPDPFFVIATQNPIEQEGTYPLPEAQLDRFMFNIKIDYPTLDEEKRILSTTGSERGNGEVKKLFNADQILRLQKLVASVIVSPSIVEYTARLVRATRPRDESAPERVRELVDWGAGPRAGQFLIAAGKALAAMDGRYSVAFDDLRAAAVPILRHRISTNFQAQAEGLTNDRIIEHLLESVPLPAAPKYVKR